MKTRSILMGAMAVLFASCSQTDEPAMAPASREIAITAGIESAGSRASISDGKIAWSAGDQIAALLDDGTYASLTLNDENVGAATGTFTGTIIGTAELAGDGFHAYYPSVIATSASVITLPASYSIGSDFTNSHAIMKAEGDGAVVFKHLGGIMKFTLRKVPATTAKIRYTTLDNQNITGAFALVRDAEGEPQYVAASAGDGSKSSVEVCFDVLTEETDIEVSFPMPVGTYVGIRLEILNAEGVATVTPTVSATATNTFARASRVSMPAITCISIVAGTETTSVWDGSSSETPEYDESTSTYTISTAAQLKGFADMANGGADFEGMTVLLDTDIDLDNNEWTPIAYGKRSGSGVSGYSFKGEFDGQGHKISGLKISSTSNKDQGVGLFGVVDGGKVKNLVFKNAEINVADSEMAAIAVGMLTGGGEVSGITVDGGSVSAVHGNGAIVGRMTISGTIANCSSSAAISGTKANVAGICGAAYYTQPGVSMTISNCVNTGTVTGAASNVGGICGFSSANIVDCENSGVVTGNGACVAGIAGEQQNAGSLRRCVNNANVVNNSAAGSSFGTGGIVGWMRYNGDVSAYAYKEAIVVDNCTNRGDVNGGASAGGIVGHLYHLGTVSNNKNYASSITAANFAAGVVGTEQSSESYHTGIDAFPITVSGNLSTTPVESIVAPYKSQYIYINDTSSLGTDIVVDGNTDVE